VVYVALPRRRLLCSRTLVGVLRLPSPVTRVGAPDECPLSPRVALYLIQCVKC